MDDKELTMDTSMLNFDKPKKWKVELWLKKARACLEQLDELESKIESMDAPRSFEAEAIKFRPYWKIRRELDILYKWMRTMELSNYALTSRDDLVGYIEYWEIFLEENYSFTNECVGGSK